MAQASPDKFEIEYPTRQLNPNRGPYRLRHLREDIEYILKDFYADTKGVLHGTTTVSTEEEEPGSANKEESFMDESFSIMEATIPFEIPLEIRMKVEIYFKPENPNRLGVQYGEDVAKVTVKKISGEKDDLDELEKFFKYRFTRRDFTRRGQWYNLFKYKKYSKPQNNNNWGGKRRVRRSKTRARRGKKRSTRRRV
jgi:hypothetical protein